MSAIAVASFLDALGTYVPERGAANRPIRCFYRERHSHGDRQKSAVVNVNDGAWICHGCGAKGGLYDAALATGRSPAEAMALLERYGLHERDSIQRATSVVEPTFGVTEDDVARFRAAVSPAIAARLGELRGWTADAIASLGVGVDGGLVVFPYHDSTGKLVGLARYQPNPERRLNGSKVKAESGSKRDLFPPPENLVGDVVYVFEGEPDVLRAWSLALPATCVPGANAWRDGIERRFEGKHVYLVFDCDVAGRVAALAAASRLLAHARKDGEDVHVVRSVSIVDLDPERGDGFDFTDAMVGMDQHDAVCLLAESVVYRIERSTS